METVTNKYLECNESISKLIKSGYLEVKLNDNTPSAFLSLSCYRAFLCDKTGIFIDDNKSRAFLDKLRLYINYTRAYLSGIISEYRTEDTEDPNEEDTNKWAYPPLSPDAWINIYVAGADDKSILIYGRWNNDKIELRPYKEPSSDISEDGN